jgi:5-methylcytosine-specific restriction endonuclease McrA
VPPQIDIIGQRFGRLVVMNEEGRGTRSSIIYRCKCDCGNEKLILGVSLRKGATISCGCFQRENLGLKSKGNAYGKGGTHQRGVYGESSFHTLMHVYKQGATRRNLEFSLEKEEFRKLTSGNCVYCGQIPSSISIVDHCYGIYVYNGVDRVDNSKGYVSDNVVSCCEYCNKAKHSKSKEEFLLWVKRIYEFSNLSSYEGEKIIDN